VSRALGCMFGGHLGFNRRLAGATTRIALVGTLEILAAGQWSQDRRKIGVSIWARSGLCAEMPNELDGNVEHESNGTTAGSATKIAVYC
jgi:hypothetical protein